MQIGRVVIVKSSGFPLLPVWVRLLLLSDGHWFRPGELAADESADHAPCLLAGCGRPGREHWRWCGEWMLPRRERWRLSLARVASQMRKGRHRASFR